MISLLTVMAYDWYCTKGHPPPPAPHVVRALALRTDGSDILVLIALYSLLHSLMVLWDCPSLLTVVQTPPLFL